MYLLREVTELTDIDWDDLIPPITKAKWDAYRGTLNGLLSCSAPRYVGGKNVNLHVFCDASETAYATTIYAQGEIVKLLCAKKRIVPLPLKSTSIPRLELLGCLLGSRLTEYVYRALGEQPDTSFRTYSMISIGWLKSAPDRWKTFVQNRVAEVQRTFGRSVMHVPTQDNPADLASCGLPAIKLATESLWWHGPTWIAKPQSWPVRPQFTNELWDIATEEERPALVTVLTTTVTEDRRYNWYLRFSNLTFLRNVTAWMMRFIRNCRRQLIQRIKTEEDPIPTLRSWELRVAQTRFIH